MTDEERSKVITYGSVCSGIETASLAWEPLGMKPLWFCEIERAPSALLAHHWPDVPNYHDLTLMPDLPELPRPDILVGGTPCQAFSIAGLREGMKDDRGLLTLKFVELANVLEPKFIVWENVPGVLSDNGNAFGCFLAGLSGADRPVEPGPKPHTGKSGPFWKRRQGIHVPRWPSRGIVDGPKRRVAWRILDAQYLRVAQRRRRVFVVASPRTSGFDPGKILFECEGLRRDTPPSREAGEEAARNIAGSFRGGREQGYPEMMIPVVPPLPSRNKIDMGTDFESQGLIPQLQRGVAFAENSSAGGRNTPTVMDNYFQVRRLMPRECERLQGIPDDHTKIMGKDSPRYKAIGNSMAVPVMSWIGKRIKDAMLQSAAPPKTN